MVSTPITFVTCGGKLASVATLLVATTATAGDCVGVGGPEHHLGGTHDVDVHLHAHLEEVQLGVGLKALNLQNFGVVAVVNAHPEVRVHAG